MKTFIIAELATTWHVRPTDRYAIFAFNDLVQQCSAVGVSAIKVQWVSDSKRMAARRHFDGDPYAYLNWPQYWMKDMAARCADLGVEWMCTAFLPGDVAIIDPYVKRHKVASLENDDTALLGACYGTGKPMLVSYGCSNSVPCFAARNVYRLHCVAAYPAPADQLQIAVLRYNRFEGFSDHSADVRTGMLAVACGAKYLEVHVRHDLTPPSNPDYGHSLTVEQLRTYVENVRWVEAALGDGIKKVEKCEEPLRQHRVISTG